MCGPDRLAELARADGLDLLGVATTGPLPGGIATLALLGPGTGFWSVFTDSAEYADGRAHPMDRWSARVIGALAQTCGAQPFFPFGANPPHPFYHWALATGRVWSSPVRLLVHDRAGLWVSFRGALGFAARWDKPAPTARPCDDFPAPCLRACPAGALDAQGYDVPRCHDWLATGGACLTQGCLVRAACPMSQTHDRPRAQSEFHMRAFHQ